ncbi:NlpC/P60 family protein [Streptomyces sp. NPDC048566]|uniref:NlpC/P60 family protein n=1 Tax=Streptomyces sp. NPDC048566 TaxID=3365569 RepID=UPI0037211E24
MRSGKRSLTTATLFLACACACVVLATPGAAYASPTPKPTATGSPAPAPAPKGSPTPAPTGTATPKPVSTKELEAVREKLDTLYHDAAVATDAYNAAEEKARKQSAEIVDLARKIAKGQANLDKLKDRAGAAARAQYRGGGLPPEARLWLSEDPQRFLDGTGRVRAGEHATKGLLDEMTRTQQDLRQYEKDASARWKKLESNREEKAEAQKKITKKIAAAEQLESRLETKEKERLAKLEEEAAQEAQSVWLGSGVLADIKAKASASGRKAVAYATDQIGKPYVWGAEGPGSFDCSGLTSQAWAAAGHPIPRTSQEQWHRLRHVAVEDMRPGDLVIYFDDASHVGMYIGDGSIVHAPRPGRNVTITGAGSMQILGVVRPDA